MNRICYILMMAPLVLVFSSCNNIGRYYNDFKTHSWAFVEQAMGNYAELYSIDEDKFYFYSLEEGISGVHTYNISNEKFEFMNNVFRIKRISDDYLQFIDDEHTVEVVKIMFGDTNLKNKETSPYYLRRSYFLVQLGLMNTDEALIYLSNTIAIPRDDFIEEELDIIRK